MNNIIRIWDGSEINLSEYSNSQLELELKNIESYIEFHKKSPNQTPLTKTLIESYKLNMIEITSELTRRNVIKHPYNNKVLIRKYRNLSNTADIISLKKLKYSNLDNKYTVFTDIITIVDSDGLYFGKYKSLENQKDSYRFNPISMISDVYSIDENSTDFNYILKYWTELNPNISSDIVNFGVSLESFLNNILNKFKSKDYDEY